MASIDVNGVTINVISEDDEEFISFTDMLQAKDGDHLITD